MASVSELACIYSALILHDDEVTVTVSVIGLSRGMNIRDTDAVYDTSVIFARFIFPYSLGYYLQVQCVVRSLLVCVYR